MIQLILGAPREILEALEEAERNISLNCGAPAFSAFLKVPDGVVFWILGSDGKYRYISDGIEKLFDIKRDKWIGKAPEDVGIPRSQAAHWNAIYRRAWRTGSSHNLQKIGKTVWVSAVQKAPGGTLVGVAMDITRHVTRATRRGVSLAESPTR